MKQNGAKGTTNKRSRQERALEQRREQLLQWQNEPSEIFQRCSEFERELDVDRKIAQCKREIATLERKLGVVHAQ